MSLYARLTATSEESPAFSTETGLWLAAPRITLSGVCVTERWKICRSQINGLLGLMCSAQFGCPSLCQFVRNEIMLGWKALAVLAWE